MNRVKKGGSAVKKINRPFGVFLVTLSMGAMVLLGVAFDPAPASAKDKYKIDPVTGTKYKADADMKDLLAAFAALGGKPIDALTPAEARKQPTHGRCR